MSIVPTSDLATIVSPLTGGTQSASFDSFLLNTEYTFALLNWIQGGGITHVKDSSVLDKLAASLTTPLETGALAAVNKSSGVHVRVSALASANQPGSLRYYSSHFPTALLNTPTQISSVYTETIFSGTDGSAQKILSRSHLSEDYEIVIFVLLTPSSTHTVHSTLPSPVVPAAVEPEVGDFPFPTCGPDESSSESCGNNYGYNYSWGLPFPAVNSTEGWNLL